MMENLHDHRCLVCFTTWQHDTPICAPDSAEYDEFQTCPDCDLGYNMSRTLIDEQKA